MKEIIKKFDSSTEYYTSEGCYINELSNDADDPDVSIAQARVKPGVTTQWHRLRETAERYIIIEGAGLVEIGELPARDMNVGDVAVIPSMCQQRITNVGKVDLIFLAICTPRFKLENYENLEVKDVAEIVPDSF